MEHPYQYADPDHIYHTLDSTSGGGGGEHPLESVGVIDVKLPNGRTVAATLVRNPGTGRVMTLVQAEMAERAGIRPAAESPPAGERQPLQQVTFPRTVVYRQQMHGSHQGQGHLV